MAPFYVIGTNYRVLIYCICHFQEGSLCFSFFCLLVSSVSNFCPDTGGGGGHFFRLLFSHTVGREGRCKQDNTGVCSPCLSHIGPVPAHHECALLAGTA